MIFCDTLQAGVPDIDEKRGALGTVGIRAFTGGALRPWHESPLKQTSDGSISQNRSLLEAGASTEYHAHWVAHGS